MIRICISRRAVLLGLGICCLGLVTLTAVTQAVAARRSWGIRTRPAYRAPSAPSTPNTPTPAAPRRLPQAETPFQEYPRPEPDPIFVPNEFVDNSQDHTPDQATLLREILEIRRRVQLDPEFRLLAGKLTGEAAKNVFEDCNDGSEDAFKQALETLNSGEYEWTVRKTSTGHDVEMVCRSERSPATSTSGTAALRSAARALEARANASEDAEDFERADDLREMARHLRLEARREE